MKSVAVKGGKSSISLAEFEAALDASDKLAAASKLVYKERMRSIAAATGRTQDFDWCITHPDDTWEALHAVRKPSRTPGSKETKPLSSQTLRASAASVVALFKHAPKLTSSIKGHEEGLEGWQELLKESTEVAHAKYEDIQPSERQKEAHIEWSDLIAVRDRLIKAFREGKKDPAGAPDDAYLVLSLLTYIPPSRADWGAVRIFRGNEPEVGSEEEKDLNYVNLFSSAPSGQMQLDQNMKRLSKGPKQLQKVGQTKGGNGHFGQGLAAAPAGGSIEKVHFGQGLAAAPAGGRREKVPYVCWNRYKTAKSYGRQVRTLPPELVKIIEETMQARIKAGKRTEWLVCKKNGDPHNNHGFAVHVSYTLQKLFDRPATLDTLRHSFVNQIGRASCRERVSSPV